MNGYIPNLDEVSLAEFFVSKKFEKINFVPKETVFPFGNFGKSNSLKNL